MTHYSKSVITILCLAFVLCAGCVRHQEKTTGNVCDIFISDYEQKTFITKSVFSGIDTLSLSPSDGVMLSQVQDMCVNSQSIYILDDNQGLSCFDRLSGEMQEYIRTVGHGAGEYIMPKAICTYGDEVYLLDERACNIYDLHLRFMKRINIDMIALDFIKIDGGFLFCNLLSSGGLGRLVHTDDEGRVIDSYLPSSMLIDVVASTKCFIRDENSTVYFFEPSSDELYRWSGQGMELCYRSVIGNSYDGNPRTTSEKEDYAYNTNWFKLKDKILNSILYLGNRYYNVYDTSTLSSVSGEVNAKDKVPFFPQWQWGDSLFGVYTKRDEYSQGEQVIVTIFRM